MKLGIHLSSYTEIWEDTGLDYIAHAAQAGYDGVELPLMFPDSYDTQRAKSLLRQYGLQCSCGTGANPDDDPSSPDPEKRARGLHRLKKCIEICDYLESDGLGGVLYAPWMQLKNRRLAAENYKWAAETLHEAGEYAGKHGVTLSLELLNRYESYFINTVEDGKHFLEMVDQENIKLHYDTFHSYIEESAPVQAIRDAGSLIGHVHLCDNNRAAPGSGNVDWSGTLNALKDIGYSRWITVENFILPDCEIGDAVCIWSGNRDRYKNAEDACKFIRSLL